MKWPLDESLDDAQLERRLFPVPVSSRVPRPLPQWSEVHLELRGMGVTLALLCQEYNAVHPEGMQYSRFCEQYRAWASTFDVAIRQQHRAGEKMFVDHVGLTVAVVDPHTREVRDAQIFRRGARGVELHLRGGGVDAGPSRLDRLSGRAPTRLSHKGSLPSSFTSVSVTTALNSSPKRVKPSAARCAIRSS